MSRAARTPDTDTLNKYIDDAELWSAVHRQMPTSEVVRAQYEASRLQRDPAAAEQAALEERQAAVRAEAVRKSKMFERMERYRLLLTLPDVPAVRLERAIEQAEEHGDPQDRIECLRRKLELRQEEERNADRSKSAGLLGKADAARDDAKRRCVQATAQLDRADFVNFQPQPRLLAAKEQADAAERYHGQCVQNARAWVDRPEHRSGFRFLQDRGRSVTLLTTACYGRPVPAVQECRAAATQQEQAEAAAAWSDDIHRTAFYRSADEERWSPFAMSCMGMGPYAVSRSMQCPVPLPDARAVPQLVARAMLVEAEKAKIERGAAFQLVENCIKEDLVVRARRDLAEIQHIFGNGLDVLRKASKKRAHFKAQRQAEEPVPLPLPPVVPPPVLPPAMVPRRMHMVPIVQFYKHVPEEATRFLLHNRDALDPPEPICARKAVDAVLAQVSTLPQRCAEDANAVEHAKWELKKRKGSLPVCYIGHSQSSEGASTGWSGILWVGSGDLKMNHATHVATATWQDGSGASRAQELRAFTAYAYSATPRLAITAVREAVKKHSLYGVCTVYKQTAGVELPTLAVSCA